MSNAIRIFKMLPAHVSLYLAAQVNVGFVQFINLDICCWCVFQDCAAATLHIDTNRTKGFNSEVQ